MERSKTTVSLRIFVGEADRSQGQPLYEAIVKRAREAGLAGATVLHGVIGFGKAGAMHTARMLRLSEDLPVVIEIVDERDRIESFLPEIDGLLTNGLVTIQETEVVLYRHKR